MSESLVNLLTWMHLCILLCFNLEKVEFPFQVGGAFSYLSLIHEWWKDGATDGSTDLVSSTDMEKFDFCSVHKVELSQKIKLLNAWSINHHLWLWVRDHDPKKIKILYSSCSWTVAGVNVMDWVSSSVICRKLIVKYLHLCFETGHLTFQELHINLWSYSRYIQWGGKFRIDQRLSGRIMLSVCLWNIAVSQETLESFTVNLNIWVSLLDSLILWLEWISSRK